jgi:3-oxoadipate enol-lactonase
MPWATGGSPAYHKIVRRPDQKIVKFTRAPMEQAPRAGGPYSAYIRGAQQGSLIACHAVFGMTAREEVQLQDRRGVLLRPESNIAYRISGHGKPLVFCHALASRQELWDRQRQAFTEKFRMVSFDLRGHGDSPPPGNGDYSFESQADDVAALMDHLNISSATLVGISVGGEVAQVAAARHPHRFDRLILVSTACHTEPARASTWEARIQEAGRVGMPGIAAATASRWFSESFASANPDVIEWCRQCVASTKLESYVGLARVIQTMDLRPKLGIIACPTMVLCGGQDHNTGPKTAQVLADLIPDSQLATFQSSGHFPNIEVADDFNGAVEAFVD